MSLSAIVDSHVHLWDPKRFRYGWLNGLPALNRPFLPPDYAAATLGQTHKIIFVECGCEPAQNLDEVDWVCSLTKSEPRLKGIVAHAPLEKGEAARDHLVALVKRQLVKGVRRNLQGEDEKFCLQPQFIAGIRLLAEFDFSFDLCIRTEQLCSVAELIRQVPQVRFVLDHCGKPNIVGRQSQPWASDLKAVAALPNVVCKLSGLTTEADWQQWQPEDLKFYFTHAVECFGFDRLLFGSDWPVASLATTFTCWLETVQRFLSEVPESERRKIFQSNAERIYHV